MTPDSAPARDGTPVVAPPPARRTSPAVRVARTVLARLRFVAVLAVIGVTLTQWDTLAAYYAKWTRPVGHDHAADPDTEYFCPMHPAVVRPDGRDKCPVCFMPLARRKKDDPGGEALPAGVVSRVQLTPYRVVLAGARTTPADYVPLVKEVTTVGTVEFDERGLKHVAARVKGRIDRLFADQTGQAVRKGDELASVYSPDLVVTVQNLLDARKAGNRDLERGARERLRLWGIDDDQVEKIAHEGRPVTHLAVRSPVDGHVLKKYPREGQYVEEGGPLYDVADLSRVWVQAQVYEEDLAFLADAPHEVPGVPHAPAAPLPVTAETRAHPGEEFAGTLSFVYPHVDPDSRTLTARFELPNPGHRLRPGMTATVRLRLAPDRLAASAGLRVRDGKVLAVPEGSVIDTGRRQVVYREASPGVFEGVEVRLGARMSGPGGAAWFPVLAGLEAGESVVTAGSFLIDAETRLNPAAGSIYVGGSAGPKAGSPPPAVRPSTPDDPDAKATASLARLSPEDRAAAAAQGRCPVLPANRLGSMGPPVKVVLGGRPVFLCCDGCTEKAKADPARTLERLRKGATGPATPPAAPALSADEEAEVAAALAKLPADDKAPALAQRSCPIRADTRLGGMGLPVKVVLNGRPVFLCCKGCRKQAEADPDGTLRKADALSGKGGGK